MNRNGAQTGGMMAPIMIVNNPRKSGKLIASYGTLVVDQCAGTICVHDGVTPGGCYCFVQQPSLCGQMEALPDLGNICPPQPAPPAFDPCLMMAALPDFGSICVAPPAPAPFDPCALMNSLPQVGAVCVTPPTPTPFNF